MNSNLSILINTISNILITIGLWKVFEKCGSKKYYALIPIYKVYIISICADRKDTGKIWFIINLINTFFSVSLLILIEVLKINGPVKYSLELLSYAVGITELLYQIKIYSSLCDIFNRRKWWVILFILDITLSIFFSLLFSSSSLSITNFE